MKKLLFVIGILFGFSLFALAYAAQITVPSAPSSGYMLVSTSTGAYIPLPFSTTTASCSGSASCTPFIIFGTSPITISATGSGGSGIGTIATSALETAGQLGVFSTTNGYPAKLYSIATGTETCSTGAACSPFTVVGTGGAITVSGLTTGNFSSANISQWTNNSNYITLASLSASAPIRYNSTTGAFDFTGLSTSTNLSPGQLPYVTGANTLGQVATTSATCSGTVACTGFTVIGASPISIVGSASASGVGTVATSALETAGQIPYWTTSSGYPAKLGTIATGTETCSTGAACSAFTVIGTGGAITVSGLSTTNFTSPNVSQWFNNAAYSPTTTSNTFSGTQTFNNVTINGTCTGCSSGSGITSIGPANQSQIGANQTLATSSATTISGLTVGLTIVGNSNTQTFTPNFTGSITGLTTGAFSSANISQWTNNSNYIALTALSATYPVIDTSGVFSLAFGTTTSNTWAGTQTFTNLITGSISGNAGTATALAANGTNCLAGNYALGVDASGNAEGCTAAAVGTVTSVTATYPILSTGGATPVISTAFGTTTQNIFSLQNIFTSLFATNASTTNATTTNLAITGGASNCNGTSALTTNSTGVVGCSAQPQGTVTAVSVATANGFAGSSSGGATPALTLTTTITGLLKGNGTSISAATPGSDYDVFAWPFTPQSYGNSTSSVIAFTGGLVSTGSTTIAGLSSGLVGNNNGLLYGFASSSLFGYVPLNPTRQLTIAGTANQITSSAGALDLSADRTWTLSIPNLFVIPSNASSTLFSTGYGSTTNAFIGTLNLPLLTGTQCLHEVSGVVSGTGSDCGSGGGGVTSVTGTYPIISSGGTTPAISTAFGTTTTNIFSALNSFNGGASTTAFTVTGVASTSKFFADGLTSCSSSNFLQWTGGTFGCATASGGSLTGTTGQVAYFSGTNTAVGTSSITIGTNGLTTVLSLAITAVANLTTTVAGAIGIDSTTGQLRWFDGTNTHVALDEFQISSFLSSSTLSYFGATSTIPIANPRYAATTTSIYCITDTGTYGLQIGNGTASTTYQTCNSSGTETTSYPNGHFTSRQNVYVILGSKTGSPTGVTVTITQAKDPD